MDQRVIIETLKEPLKRNILEKSTIHDILVIPGYGSRQRFLASIGDLPERLANSFVGNVIILHFDR